MRIQDIPQGFHQKGIDRDNSLPIVSDQSFIDALDILRVSKDENGVLAFENMQGTKVEFDLPTIVAQDKQYYIKYLTPVTTGERTIHFTLTALGVDYSFDYIFDATDTECAILQGLLDYLNTIVINGNASNFTSIPDPIVCPTDNFILATVNDLGDYVLSTTSTDYFTVYATQEYIPNDSANTGVLVPIGYKQINQVGYLFSCIALNRVDGYGEIGVIQYNSNTDSYSYTTLLGSTKFLFSLLYPIRCAIGTNGTIDQLCFVDYHNRDRCFEYNNVNGYILNGGLAFNGGFYNYDSLDTELFLEKGVPALIITYLSQTDVGGNLLAGSYYYLARLISVSNSTTAWSSVTNPIPVTKFALNSSALDFAGTGGTTTTDLQTSKCINLEISNINTDFTYLELARVSLIGGAFTVKSIAKIPITSGTIDYTDNGFDPSSTDLTLSEINVIPTDTILKSKDIVYLRNRYVRVNFTTRDYDSYKDLVTVNNFSTYTKELFGQGDGAYSNDTNLFPIAEDAEFQSAFNVHNYLGYHSNDRVYLGIRVYFNDGTISKVIPQLECTFAQVTDVTNDFVAGNVATINNIAGQVDVTIDSTLLPQISAYELVRSETIYREVLFSGMLFLGDDHATGTDIWNTCAVASDNGTDSGDERKNMFFYCTDIMLGQNYSFILGDVLRVYTSPKQIYFQDSALALHSFGFGEYSGYMGNVAYVDYSLVDAQIFNAGQQLNFGGKVTHNGIYNFPSADISEEKCIAINTSVNVVQNTYVGVPTDYGYYYCEIIRPNAGVFSNPELLNYQSLGKVELTSSTTNLYTSQFYGGNVFCQKNYIRLTNTGNVQYQSPRFSYYARNTYNFSYHYALEPYTQGLLFPIIFDVSASFDNSYSSRANKWANVSTFDQTNYNTDYSPILPIQVLVSNGINNSTLSNIFQTGIAWSEPNIQGGNNAFGRVYLPLNRKYEDTNNGAITSAWVIAGELFTMQVFSFRKQYFVANAERVNTNDSTVFIGDGAILLQNSNEVSKYGCSMTFAPFLGITGNGDDILYWINTTYKKVLYFNPQNGSRVISEIANFDRFAQNNLSQLTQDNPWINNGACGVFENDIKDAIFTVRATPIGDEWVNDIVYNIGDIVYVNSVLTPAIYEFGSQRYFKSKTNSNVGNSPESSSTNWQLLGVDDINLYTLDYSEVEPQNALNCFRTPKPYFYMRFNNDVLCPESNMTDENPNRIYRMKSSNTYATFFNGQEANAYVEFIVNKDIAITKVACGLEMGGSLPLDTYIITDSKQTDILSSEYEERRDKLFYSTIYNDTTGSANKKTNRIKVAGNWFKIKFVFGNVYSWIEQFTLKQLPQERTRLK